MPVAEKPADVFTLFKMPPPAVGQVYKNEDGFCYYVEANGTVGKYVGWWDGRKKALDTDVPEPADEPEEAEVDKDGNPIVKCDFCPSPCIIAYKDYAGECVADNCGNFICFEHGIGVDDYYCPMHSKCESCEPDNVQATKACVDCAKMLCDDHTYNKDLCKGCWRSKCGDCHGTTGAEMADDGSGLCIECRKGADLGSGGGSMHSAVEKPMSQGSADDEEGEQTYVEFNFHGTVFLQKVGSAEVYEIEGDNKVFVGILADADHISWHWRHIKYKNSKGYYMNARNNVVKVADGVVTWVGNYNTETKSIVEGACPPDVILGDVISEIGGE